MQQIQNQLEQCRREQHSATVVVRAKGPDARSKSKPRAANSKLRLESRHMHVLHHQNTLIFQQWQFNGVQTLLPTVLDKKYLVRRPQQFGYDQARLKENDYVHNMRVLRSLVFFKTR
ncbi:hypothetical protein MP228_005924 [Amoeboaphelidium protococcarum]|nr:hypothetical protein MP228_005924 [Amoeboaphelidium protococcarum]